MVGDGEAAVGRPCRAERDRTPFITNVTFGPTIIDLCPWFKPADDGVLKKGIDSQA
jgi:hypothetical protein